MVVPKSISLAGYVVKAKVEHIHAHWAAYTCTVALFASRITGVPYSFTAHRYDIVLNNLLDLKIQNASFSRFVSRSGVALAGRAAHHPNVRVIHMGVNVPESVPQRVFRKTGSFVILCPASFVPVKGHKYLLEAIRVLRDKAQGFEVWLAGTGPLLQYISHYIEAHSLGDCVKLLGHVPHPELLRLYDEGVIDAVVLSSTDLGNGLHEGVPVSLMEAMARAIPVVSTCTGGIPELLGGGAGILVEDKSPFAIAKALLRLMNSPKLGHVVGLRGYRRVQEKFWIDRIAIDLIKAFRASARRTNGMEDAVPDDNTIVSMDR
ncbi:MAG: glycosyltransferase [Alicyclobacillus sp.]|nr:glycosyltransferase [Alicyclobacillus sp.]